MTLVHPEALTKNVPEPFKSEPTGGGGTRMHHKFIVIDFDKPTARVYMGSFNFSAAADTSNGENLLLIKDRRIAVVLRRRGDADLRPLPIPRGTSGSEEAGRSSNSQPAPRRTGEKPWWHEDYTNARKILDRELFA